MNERISLKVITEQIEIPGWVKAITLTAFSQAEFSEEKLNGIYNLFATLLGMTADEARKKYALRYSWVKAITLTAFSQAEFSEEKLNGIYNLFATLLGMTADEARKKYALRYSAKFEQDRTEYLVEFFDSPADGRKTRY